MNPGWAVTMQGRLLLDTVYSTRRGAIVNWLVTFASEIVLNTTDDEDIEHMWQKHRLRGIHKLGPEIAVWQVEITVINPDPNPQQKAEK